MAEQKVGARKGGEELIIEVVAIRENHDGRVLHGWLEDQLAGVEHHRQALARALGVPDNADLAISALRAGAKGLGDGAANRKKLMISGELLYEAVAVVLERGEMADEINEMSWGKDAPDKDLERLVRR